jgi:hypothetical protein
MKKCFLLFSLLTTLVSSLTAQVVTPFLGDPGRTAFTAAAGPTTMIDFEGILASNESSHIFPGGFSVSGVNFLDINPSFIGMNQDSFIEVADGMNLGAAGTDVVYSLNDNTDMVFTTQITLPLAGVFAFGSDIKFNEFTGGGTFMVQLFSGMQPLGPVFTTEAFTTANFNQFGFIGFTSDTPITSVQIGKFTGVASSANVVLDNVRFGAPVPEPATYVSLTISAGLLLVVTRKRRR